MSLGYKLQVTSEYSSEYFCYHKTTPSIFYTRTPIVLLAKEANESMQDSAGRWFKFAASMESLVLLEKKDLPEHLHQCPSVDRPVVLKTLLSHLEDAGEAMVRCFKQLITRIWSGTQNMCQNLRVSASVR